MKVLFTILAPLMSVAMFGLDVVVPPFPVPEFADTEVSSNIVFNTMRNDVRDVKMHFTFESVSSNCIQVAFGRDANGDGILSFGETDAVYGWRNGRYFAENVKAGARTEEAESAMGSSLSVRVRMTKGSRPTHFAVMNGVGMSVLGGLASSASEWHYRPEWNLMRVTRRGPGVPAEWFRCDIKYDEFYLIVR